MKCGPVLSEVLDLITDMPDPDKRIIPALVGDAVAPAFLRSWAPFWLQPGRHGSAAA
jgi:hypothetical protein